MKKLFIAGAFGVLSMLFFAQSPNDHSQQSGGGQGELNAATEAMSSHHHEGHEHMSTHMHMTELRKPQPGDATNPAQTRFTRASNNAVPLRARPECGQARQARSSVSF